MFKRFIMIMMAVCSSYCYSDNIQYQNHVQNIRAINAQKGVDAESAFKLVTTRKGQSFRALINSPAVTTLFDTKMDDAQNKKLAESLLVVRSEVLSRLYAFMFNDCMDLYNVLLKKLVPAQQYWAYECLNIEQSYIRRNLYTKNYIAQVSDHQKSLSALAEKIAPMLGICSYGQNILASHAPHDFSNAVKLLYAQYNMVFPVSLDPVVMFKDMKKLHEQSLAHIESAQETLKIHDRPSFIGRNWPQLMAGAACAAMVYKLYQGGMGLPKQYVQNLMHFEPIPVPNQVVHEGNRFVDIVVNAKGINIWVQGMAHWLNGRIDKGVNAVMIASVASCGIIAASTTASVVHSGYKRYVVQKYRNEPMKYVVHAIDQHLSQGLHKNVSMGDIGKLYILTTSLQDYISSLSIHDQMLMKKDIADLQSFELSFEQKINVIQRMYRTYQFLK